MLAVKDWNSPVSIMVLAMNPQFEGWRRQPVGGRYALLDAAGAPVRYFPSRIDFRVSVSSRTKLIDDPPLFPLHTDLPPNTYLLSIRFQLKVFHGLHQTVLQPKSAELMGVPADIVYPDRIYRLSFALPQVPTSDRIVLEVLAPSGDRMCKFHLDLN